MLDVLDECSRNFLLEVGYYVDLDEPLLRLFGGERVKALMLNLGMQATDKIEHPLVDRSILNTQKKLSKRVRSAQPHTATPSASRAILSAQLMR